MPRKKRIEVPSLDVQVAELQAELYRVNTYCAELERKIVHLHNSMAHVQMNTVQEQLKTWSLALNRMHIGLTIRDNQVQFTKGAWCVSMDINHVLDESMHCIIAMLSKIPGDPMPWNEVDGQRGWKHPDTIQNDIECAADKAARIFQAAGAEPGEYKVEVRDNE